jgi:hypothetical protein
MNGTITLAGVLEDKADLEGTTPASPDQISTDHSGT